MSTCKERRKSAHVNVLRDVKDQETHKKKEQETNEEGANTNVLLKKFHV